MELLIGITAFLAVAGIVYALGLRAAETGAVRASLASIDDHIPLRSRERELLGPLRERVLAPAGRALARIGRRATPTGYMESVRRRLAIAGHARPLDVDRFLVVRVATVAVIPVVVIAAMAVDRLHAASLLVIAGAGLVMLLGPDAVLDHAVSQRQARVRRQLPDLLDLLTISVEAGLGFEQALERAVQGIPGDLSAEFTRMLGEIRAGADRSEALRAVDARTDIAEARSFVLAILQADTFGISIGRILRSQAREMRIKRRQVAQEAAQKAPVKMLVPMALCIFPALFVVVLGPAMINLAHGLHGVILH